MLLEKKQQARNLYFQSDLTKTQIANLLQVSRRSISNWVMDGNWERLKKSATHMPAIIAENCYHIMGHLTEHHLSEYRVTNPITPKEIDGLYKLSLTINKVKNRSTLNESMEMFGFFMEGLRDRNEELAEKIMPFVEEYVSSRASVYAHHLVPDNFTGVGGRIPWRAEEDTTEQQLDAREAFFSDPDTIAAYANAGLAFPSEEEISTLPPRIPLPINKVEQENKISATEPVAPPAQAAPQQAAKPATPRPQIKESDLPAPAVMKKHLEKLSPEDAALYAHYCRMASGHAMPLEAQRPQPYAVAMAS